MQQNRVVGVVRIPTGFGGDVAAGRNATVALALAAPTAEGNLVRASLEAALARFATAARPSQPALGLAVQAVATDPPVPYSSFLLPGVMGMTILTVGLQMSFGSVSQLREQGLLERLAVSPMTKPEWLAARMMGQTIMTLTICTVLILVGLAFFGAHLTLTLMTPLIVMAGTLVFAGLGAILAGAVKRPEVGGLLVTVVTWPLVLLSGSFFDVSALPGSLQWLPHLSPLKYVNEGLRADMVLGAPGQAAVDAGLLLLFAVVVILLGARLIDWTERD
jgi:ABC-2 type transport system permease protein